MSRWIVGKEAEMLHDFDLNRPSSEETFFWGVSSSAYQTEGAHDVDGKGPSIWDEFSNTPGKIRNNENGNDACLFYYKFEEDLRMVKELGIKHFRFSLSWPRILPEGTGKVNPKGLAYYDRVIDTCLEMGIEPWLTLYHWDLPLALERKGGWANRRMLDWFEQYVSVCARHFGDRVKKWMVLNEPLVFTGAGYFFGVHAPGRKSMSDFLAAVHHATLCQALGGRVLRQLVPDAYIGTTVSCSHVAPKHKHYFDRGAVRRVDALLNRLFVEPMLGMGYPTEDLPGLRLMEKFIQPGDEDRMPFDFDFLGVQSYTREVVRYSLFTPIVHAKIIPPKKRPGLITEMNWEVYPQGMYELLKKYSAYAGIKDIIITENGAAFRDEPNGRLVKDPLRMSYLDQHLQEVMRAKREGAKVKGYFVWTLLDNFEWAEGYHPRFGLIYVDFKTQKRLPKQSALWYAEYVNA